MLLCLITLSSPSRFGWFTRDWFVASRFAALFLIRFLSVIFIGKTSWCWQDTAIYHLSSVPRARLQHFHLFTLSHTIEIYILFNNRLEKWIYLYRNANAVWFTIVWSKRWTAGVTRSSHTHTKCWYGDLSRLGSRSKLEKGGYGKMMTR